MARISMRRFRVRDADEVEIDASQDEAVLLETVVALESPTE